MKMFTKRESIKWGNCLLKGESIKGERRKLFTEREI